MWVRGNRCKKGSAPGGSTSLRPPSEELAEFVQNGDGQAEPDNGNVNPVLVLVHPPGDHLDPGKDHLGARNYRRFFLRHGNLISDCDFGYLIQSHFPAK
jgi:hypothetical protein